MPTHAHLNSTSPPLLVATVFFPERLAQFWIGLLHRRLANLPRDDVVVPAIRDVGRDRARRALAARPAGAAGSTGAALRTFSAFRRITCTFLCFAAGCTAGRLEPAFALRSAPGFVAAFATGAVLALPTGSVFIARFTARRFARGRAFLRDIRLCRTNGRIESAEGLVEPAPDLLAAASATGGALARSASLTAASRLTAACRATCAARRISTSLSTRGSTCIVGAPARNSRCSRHSARRVRATTRSSRRAARQATRQAANLRVDAGFDIRVVVVFGSGFVIAVDTGTAIGSTAARAARRAGFRPFASCATAAGLAALSGATGCTAFFARDRDWGIGPALISVTFIRKF
jgi:hypothetical protein